MDEILMLTRITIGLLVASTAIASCYASSYTVKNYHCDGGWIKHGDDKFAILARCGTPLMQEVLSGEESPKVEKLGYEFENQNTITIFTLRGGKVVLIEKLIQQ
ncbi:DUF2845 domain-containing protein [Corallincola platygyrae]|uniref:DUF2845 domain-containing protein n=1 Tax=Corallincola platygyrae TaxID=1193278 RepID=A0ABW4XKR5_9GAMM